MNATGIANWTGSWREGAGTISTASPALLEAPYSYTSRFVEAHGIAPEELLAAAHASCFNQALANNLDQQRLQAESIQTTVDIDYEITDAGQPTIHGSHITVVGRVPGASENSFEAAVAKSARGCAISRILTCEITATATLLLP